VIDIAASDTPRWIQRFQNFDGALVLLREGVDLLDDPNQHPIVREGVIQRFEYTFELAWKTLKDFLVFRKVTLDRSGPGDVLRAAFATGYITEGAVWMEALDARNEMSHVYRRQAFDRVLVALRDRFMERFEELHELLVAEYVRFAGQ